MSRVSAPESRETWDPGPYRYPGSDLPGIPRQRKSPRADQRGGCGHSIGARGSTRDLPETGFRAGPASSTPRCGGALTGAQPLAVASYPSWSPLAFIRFRNLQSFHGLSTARTPNRYSTCCRERAPHTSGHSNASCIWWRVPDTDCSKGPSHIARHVRKKTARDGRLSDGAEALYARSAVSYGSALQKSGTKSLVFHRRCQEEETRCLSAPPWTPMLCLQSDCPSGPNQMNSDIGRTGSTKIYVAAE